MIYKPFRNFNAVIGHNVLLVKSRRYMQLQMLSVCSKYLMFSRRGLRKKVDCKIDSSIFLNLVRSVVIRLLFANCCMTIVFVDQELGL